MNRLRVINDQLQRAVAEVHRAIDGMERPDYDYKLCVELATESMQAMVALQQEFQKHLDAGTLSEELAVFTETIYHTPFHDLIQYWRLQPGSNKPEKLFYGQGAFDFKDAARDRETDWPGAVFVSATLFLDAIGEEFRGPFADALAQQEAGRPHGGECAQCGRTVTALNSMGVCEGCVMQAAIDAMEPEWREK